MHHYHSRVRRLRRRERARRRRFLAGAIVTTVLTAFSLVWLSRSPRGVVTPEVSAPEPLVAIRTEPVENADAGVETPVYPYSIIPGGAASADALRKAIDADPVVRAHYANFDVSRTRVVRLTEPRVAHVSYRIGDDVFWTKRPLLLKAGETLLTDGEHYARTRCGNQLAASPGPVSPDEPSVGEFDTPLPRLQGSVPLPPLPSITATTGSPTPPGTWPGPVFTGGGPFPVAGIPVGDPRQPRSPGAPGPTTISGPPFLGDGALLPRVIQVSVPSVHPTAGDPPGDGDPDPPRLPRIVTDDPPPPDGGSTRTVPEPQLFVLVGTGGLAWLGHRMGRKRKRSSRGPAAP